VARSKKTFSIILLLFLLPFLTILTPTLFNKKLKLGIVSILKPLLRGGNFLVYKLKKRTQRLRNFEALFEEKNRLQKEVIKLRGENIKLEELSIENERLRNLLSFKKEVTGKVIPARVIARDSTNWHKTIIIDKGTNQGVQKGMPVITPQGLVGKVIQAENEVGQVMLIIDPNLRVGALVQRTREEGIVEGSSSGLCRMKYLSLDADVKPEDIIISSGLGVIYPKGLVIGTVKSVGKDAGGLYLYAWIEPMADFSRLEEILCMEVEPLPSF
jgi:rod shape-determining protein MreC